MNVYRINLMRTRSSFAKSSSAVLAASLLLGLSASVLAAEAKDESTATSAGEGKTAPTGSQAVAQVEAAAPATQPAPVPSEEAAPDPASITEVGIQRLPQSTYPEPVTRGLPYGSLWLTFHGLQWPYMPAAKNASRFVVGLSGWGWVDTSYEKFSPWGANPKLSTDQIAYWIQQARLVLRVTPTYSLGGDWFVQGQAEFVGTEDQTIQRQATGGADTDDLWLRIGQWNKWDFMIGRYEGWEVFHLGMGLDLNTFERTGAFGPGDNYNPQFYGVTDNQYRPQGAIGNAAFHYYPLRYLRFELMGSAGSQTGGYRVLSTRPVAIFDLGWLKLKAATEYERLDSQNPALDKTNKTSRGIGGSIQFVFLPHIEFGLNVAQGTIRSIKSDNELDLAGTLTRTSFGGFANVSNGSPKHPVIFGVGSVYTHNVDQNNLHDPQVDDYWQVQNFVAIQYVALQQLYIKLVAGYARGHWDTDVPLSYDDEMYSLRLRFSFYF
jgi:hypothetical protein